MTDAYENWLKSDRETYFCYKCDEERYSADVTEFNEAICPICNEFMDT